MQKTMMKTVKVIQKVKMQINKTTYGSFIYSMGLHKN